ncbi:MAG: peptidylprolyl isomerase [Patescibacteria group bacterium]|jgi:peptidylprolyl isomerase
MELEIKKYHIKIFLVAVIFIIAIYYINTNTSNTDIATIDDKMENSKVKFETNKGDFVIELYADMPITAGNFEKLVSEGYYDGIIFHRVIKDFMIQGGDPTGTGTGGPGYSIQDEFVPGHSNERGTLSMANSGPNSGGSQFFINLVDNTFLDYDQAPLASKHPVFGHIVEGMKIIDEIGQSPTLPGDRPADEIKIIKATVL